MKQPLVFIRLAPFLTKRSALSGKRLAPHSLKVVQQPVGPVHFQIPEVARMLPSFIDAQEASAEPDSVNPQPSLRLQLRCNRPALTDWRFRGDAWIVDQGDGTLAIRLGDYSLTQIAGLPLDLAVLNHILARVWNRRSRR
jgi:hypothetical protein